VVTKGVVLFALFGAAVVAACVDDNIPPRPPTDGALRNDGSDAAGGSDGGSAAGASGDGGASDSSAGQVVPIELAAGSGCGSMRLVVVRGVVYFTEKATGTVKSVPINGAGATMVIEFGQISPGAIAVDATSIYWVAGNAIMKKPLAGGPATTFVAATMDPQQSATSGENDVNALLIDGTNLYFGRYTSAFKVSTTGAPTLTHLSQSPGLQFGQPGAFALDATHLYQTEINHRDVSRELLDGSQDGFAEDMMMRQPLAPDRIAVSRAALVTDAIAVVGDHVFWADGSSIGSSQVDQLESKGLTPPVAESAENHAITGFVISGDSVFLGESEIEAVEVANVTGGGTATIIATGQQDPSQFAVDDKNIYWRTSDCRIMKLAKP
jgi:hypothetical protein